MNVYRFIFSNERHHWLRRHLVFWACWWLFSAFLYSFFGGILNLGYFRRLPMALLDSFFYLTPHMFLSYSLIYGVIPHLLLKGRYGKTLVAVLSLFVVTAFVSNLMTQTIVAPLRQWISGGRAMHFSYEQNFFFGLLAGLRGGLTVGGLAAAIKLMKHWYTEGQKNLQLKKENTDAQLQLLKAQVHPHFLFNTLNNIYSHTQKQAPVAASMVAGLSDMLRYILYECNRPLVPLTKELRMVEEYIELEKVRYSNKLEVQLDFPATTGNLHIAPLLLLPFVENAFKHGLSQMLEHPWLRISVTLTNNTATIKLLNSKPANKPASNRHGIGIENAARRLELLYPARHTLRLLEEEDVFIVNLELLLDAEPAAAAPVVRQAEAMTTL